MFEVYIALIFLQFHSQINILNGPITDGSWKSKQNSPTIKDVCGDTNKMCLGTFVYSDRTNDHLVLDQTTEQVPVCLMVYSCLFYLAQRWEGSDLTMAGPGS